MRIHRLETCAKTCKIGKNGVVLVIDKFWKGHNGQIKERDWLNSRIRLRSRGAKITVYGYLACPTRVG